MSFSVSASGHVEGESDQAKQTEQQIVEQLREAFKGIESLTYATFSGQHVGSVDLLASDAGNTDAATSSASTSGASKAQSPEDDKSIQSNGPLTEAPSDGGASSGKDPL